MSVPIEVLMIDDDKDNYDSLKNSAAAQRIILRYAKSLEEGLQELTVNKKLLAVILDGKGFIKSDQEKGSESANFVHEALTQITLLERDQDRLIPKCVLTAWYDQLLESLSERVEVYDKKKIALDDDLKKKMFSSLRDQVINSKEYKIRNTHGSLFESTSIFMNTSVDAALYSILAAVETKSFEKNNFNQIRDIFEAVLKRLNQEDINLLPDNLFKQGKRPNLEYCIRYLKGLKINDPNRNREELYPEAGESRVPEHIASSLTFVKETSSALSHDYERNFSLYAFKASVFALAEILIWFKEYYHLNNNRPD